MVLPRENRLAAKSGTQNIFKKGRTFDSEFFRIKYLANNSGLKRFSIAAGSKIFKKAVERNFVRRRISEIIRKNLFQVRLGLDIAIIVKKNILAEERLKIEKILIDELNKIR